MITITASSYRFFRIALSALFLALLYCPWHGHAQGTVFKYQGQLSTGSSPANGSYDLTFTLFSGSTGGVAAAGPLTRLATAVSNGLFAVELDYGSSIFDGTIYFLEIGVRTNGSASYTTLVPRQQLTPTPYAITAGKVASGGIPAGTYGNAVSFNNAANSFSGNGAGLTFVNALTLGGLNSADFWRTAGNGGTTASHFIGTTDTNSLTVKVNNTPALQVRPGTTVPNLVGGLAGYRAPYLAPGVSGAVIAGGNAPSGGVNGFGAGDFHAVFDNDGVVGGGFGNKVGSNNGDLTDAAFATVSGGVFNYAGSYAAVVGGGDSNSSEGPRSVIAGGGYNQIQSEFSAIGGGQGNLIRSNANHTTIAGGSGSYVQTNAPYSFIGGGINNQIQANWIGSRAATISGGDGNTVQAVDGRWATIGGGFQNTNSEVAATIGGGYQNSASGAEATVAGGYQNVASVQQATVGGGLQNVSSGMQATVSGGEFNLASGDRAAVGGGALNTSSSFASTIGGGRGNRSTNVDATIGGGQYNLSGGSGATVPGGALNAALGSYSFAAGHQAKANHDGSFVWADSQAADFASTANNQVSFRCAGGARFESGTAGINQALTWTPGAGSWSFTSDRATKEGFEPIDASAVLEKVVALPITQWNYKGYPQKHIGAMAQDFHAAFPLNDSNTTLNETDLHGVAFSAIQGLNQKVEAENAKLRAENEALKARLERLEKLLEKGAPSAP